MITRVPGASEDAGPVLLDIPGSLHVLAVVAPVLGRAEPLRAELPVEDARHLDAVLRLEHVRAVGEVAVDDDEAGVPELGAGEVPRAVTLVAADLRLGEGHGKGRQRETEERLEEHGVFVVFGSCQSPGMFKGEIF